MLHANISWSLHPRGRGKFYEDKIKMASLETAIERSSPLLTRPDRSKSPLTMRKEEVLSKYGGFFLESTLAAEYAQLLRHPVPGVYVLPSSTSSLMWYGLLFVRAGVYRGAILRFTLSIPTNYPDGGSPRLDFQSGVYHPLIDYYTGELETKREFQRWRRDVNYLHNLLLYARRVFVNIDTRNPLNKSAAHLYSSDKKEFEQRVRENVEQCREAALTPDPSDPNSLHIGEWQAEVMRTARKEIFEPELNQASSSDVSMKSGGLSNGLSWVKPGSYQPFSKQ